MINMIVHDEKMNLYFFDLAKKNFWCLVPGPWSLVLGPWSLVLGPWCSALGTWSLVLCGLAHKKGAPKIGFRGHLPERGVKHFTKEFLFTM